VSDVLIIVVTDGGADEFSSIEEWQGCHGKKYVDDSYRAMMQDTIDRMEPGTFMRFGGGWVFKGGREAEKT
jgi:hypothetical protein